MAPEPTESTFHPGICEKARESVREAGASLAQVEIAQGGVANLPYPSQSFDLALSINDN